MANSREIWSAGTAWRAANAAICSRRAEEERVGGDEQCAGSALGKGRKRCVDLALAAGVEDAEFQSKRVCCVANGRHPNLGTRKGRIHQHRDRARFRNEFVQQLYALGLQRRREKAHARHVAAWSVEAGNEAELDRVVAHLENNRNRRGRRLGRECGSGALRSNYCYLTADEIGRKCQQPVILACGPAVFDPDVLALDISAVGQTLPECRDNRRIVAKRPAVEEPDHRHRRLLPARRERPCHGCTAKKRDELAPPHSITSSARASSLSGIVMPSALAVLRLMTRSNFVGCTTGRSPGLAPLRIRPA